MTSFKGHICADAVTRYIEALNSSVTEFNVAENYTDRKNNQYTQYYRIAGYGDQYARIKDWLKKGRYVEITGRVKAGGYVSKETGKVVTYLQVNNPKIEFLDKKPQVEDAPAIPTEEPAVVEETPEAPFA